MHYYYIVNTFLPILFMKKSLQKHTENWLLQSYIIIVFYKSKKTECFHKKRRFGSIVNENCLNFLEVGQGLDGFIVIRVESAMQAC